MHTPGHCPGHVCFYDDAAKVLFAGIFHRIGVIGFSDMCDVSKMFVSESIII